MLSQDTMIISSQALHSDAVIATITDDYRDAEVILVDCRQDHALTATMLSRLVRLQQELNAYGANPNIYLSGGSPAVKEVLRILQLHDYMHIIPIETSMAA